MFPRSIDKRSASKGWTSCILLFLPMKLHMCTSRLPSNYSFVNEWPSTASSDSSSSLEDEDATTSESILEIAWHTGRGWPILASKMSLFIIKDLGWIQLWFWVTNSYNLCLEHLGKLLIIADFVHTVWYSNLSRTGFFPTVFLFQKVGLNSTS